MTVIKFHNLDDDVLVKYFSNDEQQCYLLFSLKQRQVTIRTFNRKGVKGSEDRVKTFKFEGLPFEKDEVIETAISNSSVAKGKLFLFGKKHVYTVDMVGKIVTDVDDWDVANMTLIDNHYLYSIMNENSDQPSGFYIQSINTFINPKNKKVDSSKNFKLKNALGGQSNILKYFYDQDKVAIQSDFSSIRILPIIHRNTLSFYGMKPSTSYLAFRRLDDKLIGLDRHQTLTTWSLMTAKITNTFTFTDDKDLAGFVLYPFSDKNPVFHRDWYQDSVLLWRKQPPKKELLEDVDL